MGWSSSYGAGGPMYRSMNSKSSVQSEVTPPRSLSGSVPIATVGEPIPYICGRRRISRPNVIGYSNPRGLYETTTTTDTKTYRVPGRYVGAVWEPAYDVEETVTTETTVAIGFIADMTLGICLGPGVVLRGIYADKEALWTGSVGPARATFTLPENETAFSKVEIAFNGGDFDQDVDPWLSSVPDQPAYVGVAYMILRGVRMDVPLEGLTIEVERFPNPASFPGARNRRNDDINCATAMIDVITNEWGGAGVPLADLDIAGTFTAASVVFGDEDNFASVVVEQETVATAVLGALQDQTYSIVYQNPGTAKIEVRPIRETAVPGSAKNFGRTTLLGIQGYQKSSWASTLEVLRGTYVERGNHYEPTPIMVQNVTTLTVSGRGRRSADLPYPYVTNADLGLFLASRDLASVSVPRFSASILATRYGASCLPGDVVRFSEQDYGFWGVPVVVEKVRKAPLKENTVLLTVSEYVLPDTSPLFDTPEDPYDPGIDYNPKTPTGVLSITSPYWIAARAGRVTPDTSQNVVYPLLFPTPANDMQLSYEAYIANMPGVTGETLVQANGVYTTYAQLGVAISRWDGLQDGQLATITIDGVVNGVNLKTYSTSDQRAGRPLVFIGNEIFTFASATQTGPSQWQLNGVKRALLDTVAVNHAPGAGVYIVDGADRNIVPLAFNYPLAYTPQWRLISTTINGKQRIQDALAYNGWNSANLPRTLRPVRPHDTRIAGVRSDTPQTLVVGDTYNVTWRTRGRASPSIAFQNDPAEPSEGTTGQNVTFHRVYIRDSTNTLRLCGATQDDGNYNSLVVTIPGTVIEGTGTLFVRSVNQHGESLFDDTLPVEVWAGSNRTVRYAIEA